MNNITNTGNVWTSALKQLQRVSYDVGQSPLLGHWWNFLTSLRHQHISLVGAPNRPRVVSSGSAGPTSCAAVCMAALPREVWLTVVEGFVDGARSAQLQRLLQAPAGILRNGSHVGLSEEGKAAQASDKAGVDEVSPALCGSSTARTSAQLNLEEVLFMLCASHETPYRSEQLEMWLRKSIELLHFFTLRSDPHMEHLRTVPQQQCIEYPSTLCVLLRALCAMYLRSAASEKEGDVARSAFPHLIEEEVGLLGLWLLRSIHHFPSYPFVNLLQLTQMLLASGVTTRLWLLDVPLLFRPKDADAQSLHRGACRKEGHTPVKDMLERSPICHVARDIVPVCSHSPSACLQKLFVDPHHSVGEEVVLSLNEHLSRIAAP